MKTFEELKEDLLERAKKHQACQDGYSMGLNAKSKQDLLKAITDNWHWFLRTSKMIDANYLEENFTEEELTEAGIYTRKEHTSNAKSFAYGSATVKAYGSATVKAYGSATVKACGSATVEAYDYATVKAYGSATVKAYDNSYVEDCTGNINTVSDHGIVKDYYNHKIYIKKGKFEIIEIE
ncbi:hypothetical protein LK516_02480 [Parabacteroides distasonis]|uniref:hypothetical protein n=1 Tax=Parabacteroides distasonis TaxID=823 RepID=UPI001D12C485|nr:hypothetical protein [Parabacteroides distasonis]MCC2766782.1 hypothetical protein [Parabacteroides distasonis]